jgi:hypothetical protein
MACAHDALRYTMLLWTYALPTSTHHALLCASTRVIAPTTTRRLLCRSANIDRRFLLWSPCRVVTRVIGIRRTKHAPNVRYTQQSALVMQQLAYTATQILLALATRRDSHLGVSRSHPLRQLWRPSR